MPILGLENINKHYGKNHVVKNLSLHVEEGEFLTVLGPSGCGKTTTLRMIGGFEIPESGRIVLHGKDITTLPPYQRNVNTVFQNYALFPNMNVAENVAFGLRQQGKSPAAIEQKVADMLDMVQMRGFEKRKPQELSGGQQQRVAIARAVACDPITLLLDEPLGALDLKLRKTMQQELKTLQKTLGKTFIYVTHDQEEALSMSDRIAVMNQGVLEQIGSPNALYYHPQTRFVADFIGEANQLEAVVRDAQTITINGFDLPIRPTTLANGSAVTLFVRPECVQIGRAPGDAWHIEGTISDLIFIGAVRKYTVRIPGKGSITASETTFLPPAYSVGDAVSVWWAQRDASVFGR